ncbi:hypothetical protein ACOMHN_009772 [Nucella lapillus]
MGITTKLYFILNNITGSADDWRGLVAAVVVLAITVFCLLMHMAAMVIYHLCDKTQNLYSVGLEKYLKLVRPLSRGLTSGD